MQCRWLSVSNTGKETSLVGWLVSACSYTYAVNYELDEVLLTYKVKTLAFILLTELSLFVIIILTVLL